MSAGGFATKYYVKHRLVYVPVDKPPAPEQSLHEDRDLQHLAPRFREAVQAFLAECVRKDMDAMVWEGLRSDALAQLYYKRGRPPTKEYPHPVTNAPNARYTWHGYGLAVDVIHAHLHWNAPMAWFREMADIAKQHDMKWGGDWKHPDYPHLQWYKCKPSPSDIARHLLDTEGVIAVQKTVGAWD